jgi:hypothetical protein
MQRRIKQLSFIIFILTAVIFRSAGQKTATLKGVVTGKSDGYGLISANVFIKGTNLGTSTDMDGNYNIKGVKPGVYNVEFTYLGYKKTLLTGIKLKAGEVKELNVEMESTSLTIEKEVVIIGEKPLVDVEQSKTESIISSEKIEAAPVRDISGLLNSQAGILNSPSGLRIRGGRTYETGFYIDGVSAKDPLAGTGMGLDIGSNSIQEMEVSTGGIDVEYGNSTSGTINTKTKSGGDKFTMGLSYKTR